MVDIESEEGAKKTIDNLEEMAKEALEDFDPMDHLKKILEKEISYAKDERAQAIVAEQAKFADGLWRGKDQRAELVRKFFRDEWFATESSNWIDFIAGLTGRDKEEIKYDKDIAAKVTWLYSK